MSAYKLTNNYQNYLGDFDNAPTTKGKTSL